MRRQRRRLVARRYRRLVTSGERGCRGLALVAAGVGGGVSDTLGTALWSAVGRRAGVPRAASRAPGCGPVPAPAACRCRRVPRAASRAPGCGPVPEPAACRCRRAPRAASRVPGCGPVPGPAACRCRRVPRAASRAPGCGPVPGPAACRCRRGPPAASRAPGCGPVPGQHLVAVAARRELLLELLDSGPFLRQQLVAVAACRSCFSSSWIGPVPAPATCRCRRAPQAASRAPECGPVPAPAACRCRRGPPAASRVPWMRDRSCASTFSLSPRAASCFSSSWLRARSWASSFSLSPRAAELLLELLAAGPFLRQQLVAVAAGRQLLLELLAARPFLGQQLVAVAARRELLLEFLAAGPFLGQQLVAVAACRELLLEFLAAGPFLGQQLVAVAAGRQLLLEFLVAGPFLGQQLVAVAAGRELLLELLAAGPFLRQQLVAVAACRELLLEFLAAGRSWASTLSLSPRAASCFSSSWLRARSCASSLSLSPRAASCFSSSWLRARSWASSLSLSPRAASCFSSSWLRDVPGPAAFRCRRVPRAASRVPGCGPVPGPAACRCRRVRRAASRAPGCGRAPGSELPGLSLPAFPSVAASSVNRSVPARAALSLSKPAGGSDVAGRIARSASGEGPLGKNTVTSPTTRATTSTIDANRVDQRAGCRAGPGAPARDAPFAMLLFLLRAQVLLMARVAPVVVCTAPRIAQDLVGLSDEPKFLGIMWRSTRRCIRVVAPCERQIGGADDFPFSSAGDAKQRVIVGCHRAVPGSSWRAIPIRSNSADVRCRNLPLKVRRACNLSVTSQAFAVSGRWPHVVGYRQNSSEPLMQAKDRERLVKLLSMTHSASDGEALTAIRKCNELLRQHKVSWNDAVAKQCSSQPQRTPREGANPFRGAARTVWASSSRAFEASLRREKYLKRVRRSGRSAALQLFIGKVPLLLRLAFFPLWAAAAMLAKVVISRGQHAFACAQVGWHHACCRRLWHGVVADLRCCPDLVSGSRPSPGAASHRRLGGSLVHAVVRWLRSLDELTCVVSASGWPAGQREICEDNAVLRSPFIASCAGRRQAQ